MTNARKLHLTVPPDHTIRLPDDIPEGPVEVIVLFPSTSDAKSTQPNSVRGGEGMFDGQIPAAELEDALGPLPDDVQRYFEGYSDPEDGLA